MVRRGNWRNEKKKVLCVLGGKKVKVVKVSTVPLFLKKKRERTAQY